MVLTITNDGVTIARDIDLKIPENLGCQLVKEVATKTNDIAWRWNYYRHSFGAGQD